MMPLLMAHDLRAEGQQNDMIVLGEKGRAQLVRDRAKYIKETIADTQKVRITFSQVSIFTGGLTFSLSQEAPFVCIACFLGCDNAAFQMARSLIVIPIVITIVIMDDRAHQGWEILLCNHSKTTALRAGWPCMHA